MPTNSLHDCPSASENRIALTWTVHLARESPGKLACSIVIALAAVAVGYWAIGPLGSIAAAFALAGALADFLFPVTYQISPEGAACKMLFKSAEIKWTNVRHCYLDAAGMKLSPLERSSRLEAFRGVYVRFNGNKEQVIEAVGSLRRNQ